MTTTSRVDRTIRIVPGSGGSFLCPPGHPMHHHQIESGSTRNPNLIAGLDYALLNEYGDVPEKIRLQVRGMYAEAKLVMSEDWVRMVYGYFRNCYSPDGVNRNAGDCLIIGHAEKYSRALGNAPADHRWSDYDSLNRGPVVEANDPRCIPEHHLAFLLIRSHFRDATPRLDLIADASGGYGQQPCATCGTALQYEAKVDAWATPITARRDCAAGAVHDIERSTR